MKRRLQLTAREASCLGLLANGKSIGEIAAQLEISSHTVVTHIHKAKTRLRALSREHAVAIAMHHGFIELTADPMSGEINSRSMLVNKSGLLPKSWRKAEKE